MLPPYSVISVMNSMSKTPMTVKEEEEEAEEEEKVPPPEAAETLTEEEEAVGEAAEVETQS